ncbi:MAG: AmmeMemoRadiSam system radical SAM enzyme [Candidatus Omnitrophica bacterium]|nr:AmmeMemoRadiSam system radical SAM enzyme [Candidatus Omnitrophota bacterium]
MLKEAMFYEKLEDKIVRCNLCSHQCKILPSKIGVCGVRQNIEGTLNTLVYGEVIANNVDPIEKKPLYHFYPGTKSYSIAAKGCNFKCGFCQNWQISQMSEQLSVVPGYEISPIEIVLDAEKTKCKSISYTYTEPTIFFEYAYDIAKLAKEKGMHNVFVSNGYMTEKALKKIGPFLDAINIDLKSFSEEFYITVCKGHLNPVLDSIKLAKDMGIWVEITTLIIPGQNDSQEELREITEFIAGVGKDIPWHINRFYPNYKFLDKEPTPIETLKKAYQLGKKAGLRYIYMGNVSRGSDTYCYKCHEILIQRIGFDIVQNNLDKDKCSFCGEILDGIL